MNQYKRETAIICKVSDLLAGSFVKTEGWNPSYLTTERGNLSRINLMGVIVSRNEEGTWLDDGSGKILLRSFEGNSLDNVAVGDFIILIGKPRAYNEQKYVVSEIAKKIDPRWAEFRKAQLANIIPEQPKEKRVVVSDAAPTPNHFQKIMDFIKDLDAGEGAETEKVIRRLGVERGDELVRKLIEEGEIFEIKPGRLKILE